MHPQSGYYAGLCVVFCLSQLFGIMVGATSSNREVRAYEEASQIYNTMFVEYDKRIRPQPNHTEPVLVRMEATLDHIYNFDVTNQMLHSLLSLSLRWSDRRLAWYPQRLQSIYTQKARVWTPNLFLLNGLAQPEDLEEHTIYLEYQGNLVWHRKEMVIK
ncbi:acetylcholine receptor subunit alpha-L1 [Octopus vulgaris]|uniref:Acetylcholine receptor subunit alpha-L1 n=1 Tax=Octopus vulgaris TaxID=6645 RepID=A0AA36FKJ3_OCTVU|nr:acetylcholine receptor subunit alpha-L1 [Octopus vulgaris]